MVFGYSLDTANWVDGDTQPGSRFGNDVARLNELSNKKIGYVTELIVELASLGYPGNTP